MNNKSIIEAILLTAIVFFISGWQCKPERVVKLSKPTIVHDTVRIIEYQTKIDTLYRDSVRVKLRILMKQFCPDALPTAQEIEAVNQLAQVCDDTLHSFRDSLSFTGGYSIYDFEIHGALKRKDHFVVSSHITKQPRFTIYGGVGIFNALNAFHPVISAHFVTRRNVITILADPLTIKSPNPFYGVSYSVRLVGW